MNPKNQQKNKSEGVLARTTRNLDRASTLAGLAMTYSAAASGTFGPEELLLMATGKIFTATARYTAAKFSDGRASAWGIGRSLANLVVPPLGYVADVAVGAYDAVNYIGKRAYDLMKGMHTEKTSGIESYLK